VRRRRDRTRWITSMDVILGKKNHQTERHVSFISFCCISRSIKSNLHHSKNLPTLYGCLERTRSRPSFTLAGHPPPYHISENDAIPESESTHCSILFVCSQHFARLH
jgi:hypothetical protein